MRISLLCFACVFCGSIVSGLGASAYKGPELDSLPAAVQRTIKEQARGCKLACIEESMDQDEMIYTVEMRKAGHDRSFVVREDGDLARVQVLLDELPVNVRSNLQQQLGDGVLVQIDKFPSEDETTYDVEMTKAGHDRSFTLNGDGDLTAMEVFLEETPAAVQKTIRSRLGTGRLGDISKVIEEGEVSYEITMTRHRHSLPFSVNAQGRLISADMLLNETPDAVQKTIRNKVGDGYIEEIAMSSDEGKTTYEITFTKGDSTETFEVSNDGKLLDTNNGKEPAKMRA